MIVLLLEIDSIPQENLLSIKLSRQEHETFRLFRVGKLPQVPQVLRETYHQWSCIYQNSYANRIRPSVEQPTHLTDDYDEWKQKIEQNKDIEEKLKKYMNQWLDDLRNEEWRQVRDLIVANIQTDFEQEEVIILVRSPDQNLLKIPWHLWNIFDERNIEVCPSWGIKVEQKSVKKQQQIINILVIISEDKNLNTLDEERLWNNLKSSLVNVEVLKNPNQHEFAKLWTQNWDLLYYAGHSHTKDNLISGEAGHFWINSDVCLTTNKLKQTFKQAINNGLKLAIFNSCDGLGLAKDLTELSTPLPQVIFMRERIPDCVASKFLEDFLDAFQRGESISASVHQARGRLKEVSNFPIQLPGISLMPVVAWTLYTPMLKWQDFLLNEEPEKGNKDFSETKHKLRKYGLFLLLLSSVLSVMGIRLIGLLHKVSSSKFVKYNTDD